MIDIAISVIGLLYTLGKDYLEASDWEEEDEDVGINWPSSSGFREEMENNGYDVAWVRAKVIRNRKDEGYETFYELDKSKKKRKRIVAKDSKGYSVLMGKKRDP